MFLKNFKDSNKPVISKSNSYADGQNNFDNEALPIKRKIWKMYLVFGVLFLGLIAVSAKLFKIQVIDRDYYKKKALIQHESKVPLTASRGNIYDRNGVLLASTIESYSFAADPTILKNPKEIDSVASAIYKYTATEKQVTIDKIKNAKGSFVWLLRGINPELANQLSKIKINGFIIKSEPRRNYLFSSVGSQIVGCTDIDNHGLTGIELSLDSILQGKDGYVIMNKDASGRLRPLADLPKVEPQHGKAVQLTIDIVLQRIVEFELKRGVELAGAESGTVVAIEPSSGEVLAMASYPNFDPNDLLSLNNSALKIRAITELYEPGSTFKMVTASAAIEEGIIHPDDMVDGLGGTLNLKDYTIVDDHAIGKVSFREAFAKSSNIVLSTLAYNMESNKFLKYIRDFGFGINTGIELPGEITGRLKKIEEFDATARRFAGYGYGIAVTPLQLASAYACLAHNGEMYKPYIIKNVFDTHGNTLKSNEPQKIRRVVSASTSEKVKELLVQVVEKGTGINAKIKGMKIAGKTGTAQQLVDGSYQNKKYTASFAGFFPADNPKLALVVILDKPQGNYYGGSVAAPIFRNIAQRWISILPDFIFKGGEQDYSKTDSVKVPNLKGLNFYAAKKILQSLGLKTYPDNAKNSVILRQDPGAGTIVPIKRPVTLAFDNNADASIPNNGGVSPDLRGLSLRRALNILHKYKIKAIVKGDGLVSEQLWGYSDKSRTCTLLCK
jgi:cell division protein FtsI (penicillin-binding protein 3)